MYGVRDFSSYFLLRVCEGLEFHSGTQTHKTITSHERFQLIQSCLNRARDLSLLTISLWIIILSVNGGSAAAAAMMMKRKFAHKKNSVDERVIHDEEFGEQDVEQVDAEWAEFERALRDFRERRLRDAAKDKGPSKKKGKKKVRTQTFYPCPPPSMSEMDNSDDDDGDDQDDDDDEIASDDGFVSTLVS